MFFFVLFCNDLSLYEAVLTCHVVCRNALNDCFSHPNDFAGGMSEDDIVAMMSKMQASLLPSSYFCHRHTFCDSICFISFAINNTSASSLISVLSVDGQGPVWKPRRQANA